MIDTKVPLSRPVKVNITLVIAWALVNGFALPFSAEVVDGKLEVEAGDALPLRFQRDGGGNLQMVNGGADAVEVLAEGQRYTITSGGSFTLVGRP